MPLVSTTDEAEQIAKDWMRRRYGNKISKVRFHEVMLQDGVWTLRAEAEVPKGVLSTAPVSIVLKVDADAPNVVGYSESPRSSQPA
jgi:hypothetical protein